MLPVDRDALAQARGLDFNSLPQPYAGSPQLAELYVLTLNPGLAKDQAALEGSHEYLREQSRRALLFETNVPFWKLDPELDGLPVYNFWRLRLAALAQAVGWEALRQRMMSVQFFPYPSNTFSSAYARIPSQEFSFNLVRDAIAHRRAVVIARGRKLWTHAVPQLREYPCYELRSVRAVFLTPDNVVKVQPGGFDEIVDRLREGAA